MSFENSSDFEKPPEPQDARKKEQVGLTPEEKELADEEVRSMMEQMERESRSKTPDQNEDIPEKLAVNLPENVFENPAGTENTPGNPVENSPKNMSGSSGGIKGAPEKPSEEIKKSFGRKPKAREIIWPGPQAERLSEHKRTIKRKGYEEIPKVSAENTPPTAEAQQAEPAPENREQAAEAAWEAANKVEQLPPGFWDVLAREAGMGDKIEDFKLKLLAKSSGILMDMLKDEEKFTKENLEPLLTKIIDKLGDEFPRVKEIKEKSGEVMKDFIHDMAGVMKEEDKGKRDKMVDDLFEKYGMPGEIKALTKTVTEISSKGIKTAEDIQKGEEVKKKASKFWEKSWIGAIGFGAALFTMGLLIALMISMKAAEGFLGKGKK